MQPKINHQIRATSGRKKLKSIRLWIKNTIQAAIRQAIWVLFKESLMLLRADLSTAKISHRKDTIPNIPISAHICK